MDRLRREEAKITAWENLQKAKAEAALRKLEVSNFYSLWCDDIHYIMIVVHILYVCV